MWCVFPYDTILFHSIFCMTFRRGRSGSCFSALMRTVEVNITAYHSGG